MEIQNSTFEHFREIEEDGLVLLGTGGDLMEWVDGVSQMLKDKGIAQPDFEVTQALKVETTGGRIDLLLLFDWSKVDTGKLAMWSIAWGDVSWLIDYKVNYADHHGYTIEEDDSWDDEEEVVF